MPCRPILAAIAVLASGLAACSRDIGESVDVWTPDHPVAGLEAVRRIGPEQAEVQVEGEWVPARWTPTSQREDSKACTIGLQGQGKVQFCWVLSEDADGHLAVQDEKGILHPLDGPRL